jgi:hypothetical protein
VAERRRKAAREPRTPKEPEKPFSAVEQALGLADKPGLSGSRSGAFTYGLLSQAWRALCHNAQGDPETVEVARIAARHALTAIAPRDPVEGMMAAQLVGLHDAAMECFRRGAMREQSPEYRDTNLTQANKLVRPTPCCWRPGPAPGQGSAAGGPGGAGHRQRGRAGHRGRRQPRGRGEWSRKRTPTPCTSGSGA